MIVSEVRGSTEVLFQNPRSPILLQEGLEDKGLLFNNNIQQGRTLTTFVPAGTP